MAKNLSPVELAAALESMGMPVPDELKKKVSNAVADTAETYISEKLAISDEKKKVTAAEEWRERLFTLGADVQTMFNGQEKNVGQGRVFERFISIELPDGSNLTVRHREPRDKK